MGNESSQVTKVESDQESHLINASGAEGDSNIQADSPPTTPSGIKAKKSKHRNSGEKGERKKKKKRKRNLAGTKEGVLSSPDASRSPQSRGDADPHESTQLDNEDLRHIKQEYVEKSNSPAQNHTVGRQHSSSNFKGLETDSPSLDGVPETQSSMLQASKHAIVDGEEAANDEAGDLMQTSISQADVQYINQADEAVDFPEVTGTAESNALPEPQKQLSPTTAKSAKRSKTSRKSAEFKAIEGVQGDAVEGSNHANQFESVDSAGVVSAPAIYNESNTQDGEIMANHDSHAETSYGDVSINTPNVEDPPLVNEKKSKKSRKSRTSLNHQSSQATAETDIQGKRHWAADIPSQDDKPVEDARRGISSGQVDAQETPEIAAGMKKAKKSKMSHFLKPQTEPGDDGDDTIMSTLSSSAQPILDSPEAEFEISQASALKDKKERSVSKKTRRRYKDGDVTTEEQSSEQLLMPERSSRSTANAQNSAVASFVPETITTENVAGQNHHIDESDSDVSQRVLESALADLQESSPEPDVVHDSYVPKPEIEVPYTSSKDLIGGSSSSVSTKKQSSTDLLALNGISKHNGTILEDPLASPGSSKKKKTLLKAKKPLSSTIEERSNMDSTTPSSKGKERASWTAVNTNGHAALLPQIGVHGESDTPSVKRKRRMPVELLNDEELGETSKKKAKKSTSDLKASKSTSKSTPKSSAAATKADTASASRASSSRTPKRTTTGHKESGPFNSEQFEDIKHELLKYREMHDIDEHTQNELIAGSITAAGELWNQICEAFPNRARMSIIKFCRRKFHNYSARGTWTGAEDEELKSLNESFPNKWLQIGEIMHRHPEDCRDRWRNYGICGDKMKKDRWSDEEEAALRDAVADCIYSVQLMKKQHLEKYPGSTDYANPDIEYVDWQVVSKQLDHTRSRLQCMSKWKTIEEREAANGNGMDLDLSHNSWRITIAKREYLEMSRANKIALVAAIQESNVGREGKVPWGKLDGEGLAEFSPMVRKVAWVKLRATIPGNRNMKFQEIVTKLLQKMSSSAANADEEAAAEEQERLIEKARSKRKKSSAASMPKSNKLVTETDDEDEAEIESTEVAKEIPRPAKKSKSESKIPQKKKGTEKVMAAEAEPQEDDDVEMIDNFEPSTPAKPPKSKRPKSKSTKRRDPVVETSPPQQVKPVVAEVTSDSSTGDDDIEDIPVRLREISAEL